MSQIAEELMDVGIRQLRDSLSRYLAEVEAGRTITVTDHGKPVARIVPVTGPTRLEQLIAEGRVTRAQRPRGALREPIAANGSVSEFIAEQRG